MKELKFAENLRNLRKCSSLTQKQIAGLVGVDQRTVSAWEKGVCEPSFTILLILCEIFDETIENLLT